MCADGVLEGLALAERTGVLAEVLPELSALHSVEQSHYHHLDVYDHTVDVLARLLELERDLAPVFGELGSADGGGARPSRWRTSSRAARRCASLRCSTTWASPPPAGERPDGRVTFIGHDATGDEMVRAACRRLRASSRLASFLGAVTRHHLVLGFLVHQRPLSRRDVYRYLRTVDPVEVEVTLFTCADRLATRGRNAEPAIAAHLEVARELMGPALEWRAQGPPSPLLRGDELAREVGIEPGPELGELVRALEEATYAGEVADREGAVELARRLRQDALERVIVDCAIYDEGKRRDGEVEPREAYDAAREKGSFVWIGLYEPSEEEFDSIQREFELHELAVEDAINAHQRPKIETYGDTTFLVLKTARYIDPDEIVQFGEILVFLGHDFIVTVRHGEASSLTGVRENLESRPDLLAHGPGAVLHSIVDRVVDDYFPAVAGLEEDIEEVENSVFSAERTNPAERIYRLKREVQQFHRAASPLMEPMDRLTGGRVEQIHPEVQTYFQDVNDHLARVNDRLDVLGDGLTSILQANLAQVTVQQNDDVRRISAIVAIIAVPTAIAGIYGMNFEHMPELKSEFGYPAVLGLMAADLLLAVPLLPPRRLAIAA